MKRSNSEIVIFLTFSQFREFMEHEPSSYCNRNAKEESLKELLHQLNDAGLGLDDVRL